MSHPRPKVFVARRIPQIGIDLLSAEVDAVVHSGSLPPTRSELLSGVGGCSGILSLLSDRIDDEVLDAAGPELRVVSNFAVGYNNIDTAACARRGIVVGNTPDVLTDATADIAVALLLAAARCMKTASQAVDQLGWKTWEPLGWIGADLKGKTLGIVGMGRIGEATAKRLVHGWDMKLLYTARSNKPSVDSHLKGRRVELDQLLRDSDFVSIHTPLSSDTRHLMNAERLALMKPTAVLVNTARGEVVDQQALEHALRTKMIFAAGLDVCDPEPLPSDSPLRELDNCLVLPHIGSATVSARNAMAERAARNVLAGIRRQPLPFPVPLPQLA
ncbi:MAG: D-glycerate dehydrogenase [Pirellulales bacterium]